MNDTASKRKWTRVLMEASESGSLAQVRKALANGANLEARGGLTEDTPLMKASRKGHVKVVRFLLQAGAKVNRRVNGETALAWVAAVGRNPEVVDVLLEAGADINDEFNRKPALLAAAQRNVLPMVQKLVERGADIHGREGETGKNALDFAIGAKNKPVIAYLKSLGLSGNLDANRKLLADLRREFGGKMYEHSQGLSLNSKLAGHQCQFHCFATGSSVNVFGFKYSDSELREAKNAEFIIAHQRRPKSYRGKPVEVAAATRIPGLRVFRSVGKESLAESFIIDFCRRHERLLADLNLCGEELVTITPHAVRFVWNEANSDKLRPRLMVLIKLFGKISATPQPERRLFEREWLLKSATKPNPNAAHSFGGEVASPIGCPHCGSQTNLMAQLDLSDSSLPRTSLGKRKIPVFWCLSCFEWGPTFYDIGNETPKPLNDQGQRVKRANLKSSEGDLEQTPAKLSLLGSKTKAGGRSKVGGGPRWVQQEAIPECPRCERAMSFLLQLASDSEIAFADMGLLYAFVCEKCKVIGSLIQSH